MYVTISGCGLEALYHAMVSRERCNIFTRIITPAGTGTHQAMRVWPNQQFRNDQGDLALSVFVNGIQAEDGSGHKWLIHTSNGVALWDDRNTALLVTSTMNVIDYEGRVTWKDM